MGDAHFNVGEGVYMECIKGSSNKYYSVLVVGNVVHLRAGRCGTLGNPNEKPFPSAAKAQEFAVAQVQSKIKPVKGYKIKPAAPGGYWEGEAGGIREATAEGRPPRKGKTTKGRSRGAASPAAAAASSAASSPARKRPGGRSSKASAAGNGTAKPKRARVVAATPSDAPESGVSSIENGVAVYWKSDSLSRWATALLPAGTSTSVKTREGPYSHTREAQVLGYASREEALQAIKAMHRRLLKRGFSTSVAPPGAFATGGHGGSKVVYSIDSSAHFKEPWRSMAKVSLLQGGFAESVTLPVQPGAVGVQEFMERLFGGSGSGVSESGDEEEEEADRGDDDDDDDDDDEDDDGDAHDESSSSEDDDDEDDDDDDDDDDEEDWEEATGKRRRATTKRQRPK